MTNRATSDYCAVLREKVAQLEAELSNARGRAAFMLTACREAQTLCAAAQEAARRRGDALSGAEMIKPAFRAFEIADAAMFLALDSYGAEWDEHCVACTLVDDASEPVTDIGHAITELREAVDWLKLRGYVELLKGDDGALHVIVFERPEWAS